MKSMRPCLHTRRRVSIRKSKKKRRSEIGEERARTHLECSSEKCGTAIFPTSTKPMMQQVVRRTAEKTFKAACAGNQFDPRRSRARRTARGLKMRRAIAPNTAAERKNNYLSCEFPFFPWLIPL